MRMPDITEPFDLVLFGASGDLALRKLIPALYYLHLDGRLHEEGRIWAVTRNNTNIDAYLEHIYQAAHQHGTEIDQKIWQGFCRRIRHIGMDLDKSAGYSKLAKKLNQGSRRCVYYCAVHSRLYPEIAEQLFAQNLINELSIIVLEKPIGSDYQSGQAINRRVAEFFNESQIYRIDHYLGKETVQNLLALRFANSIFEHQWNQRYIDHVQITISETVGVEQRAGFYEGTGALRDMLQNHLLQLLCMTAMEPPASMEPEAVRDEKVKVIKALKPITGEDLLDKVVRGQYEAGLIQSGEGSAMVPRYRDEPGVSHDSYTDTFVAVKAEIDNWRWAGVPFYLRTGKRLAERACEIVVQFKEVPHSLFEMQNKKTMANKLVFRLQPDEGVRLQMCEKRIGNHMQVRPMTLSLNNTGQKKRVPDAYERLLADAINANATLFLREDELMSAWQWADPILQFWQQADQRPEPYSAGSWGPAASTLLLAKDGRLWQENS
ncbi:MAG: glucose-6-phosphate dehydrogenase [Gammaproteobacteria bacterium]|nr:glucose-6-phosphate dehydrogenase [Gammaproteobacteria bacterium]